MSIQPEDTHVENRSTTGLLSDLIDQTTSLFRKEVQLFRAEVSEKTNQAASAAGAIVGGLIVALVAFNVLAAALVSALAELGLAPGWAALIVGCALAVIAYVLVMSGIKNLQASSLSPDRTAASVQKDIRLAKESVR